MLPRTTLTLTINSASVFDLLLQPAFHSPMIRPKIYSAFPATEACRCYSWHPLGMSIDLRRFCLFTCTPLNFTSTTWNDAISSRLLSNRTVVLPHRSLCQSIVGVAVMITPPLNLPSVSLGSTESTSVELRAHTYLYVLVHGFLHKI